MRRFFSLTSLLLFSLCLGMGSVTAECIGVVTAGGGADFWKLVERGARSAAAKIGTEVYVRGANNELNVEGQGALINTVLDRGCGALVLAPNSPERAVDVALLKSINIATVYIDRDVGGAPMLIIKTDNYMAGALAGRKMAKALGGKGKVALFRLDKSVVTTAAREQGFIDEAVKGGLEVVVDVYLGTTVGSARFKALSILNHMQDVQGIFTPNELTTLATVVSLRQLERQGSMVHIGFDSNRSINAAIVNKDIYGVVIQQPFAMGYLAVYAAYQAMLGHQPELQDQPLLWDTGVLFVDHSNINQAKVKQVLGLD
ncbi:substrate-binding domain-containing protein [Agarivorans sp. QJM3NY_25]|uniref:substrate-binding domain-containing protein n=1 Tax=Agarivorans sp. QJM3NY_25 TaxID=3421430 RepID=UPI003D7CECAE